MYRWQLILKYLICCNSLLKVASFKVKFNFHHWVILYIFLTFLMVCISFLCFQFVYASKNEYTLKAVTGGEDRSYSPHALWEKQGVREISAPLFITPSFSSGHEYQSVQLKDMLWGHLSLGTERMLQPPLMPILTTRVTVLIVYFQLNGSVSEMCVSSAHQVSSGFL